MRISLGRPAKLLAATFMIAQASASNRPTDADLRKQIVGSWTSMPGDTSQMSNMVEKYRSDGTVSLYVVGDPSCRNFAKMADGTWRIENGILITVEPGNVEDRDEIVSADGAKMTLHSVTGGDTYIRVKSGICQDSSI